MNKKTKRVAASSAAFILACLLFSCGGNEGILKSGKETPAANAASPKDPVDKEMEAMRTAGFEHVYLLKRNDLGKLEPSDKEFIKAQTPDVNRRVVTEDERAILIGSNTELPKENIDTIWKYFSIGYYPLSRARNVNRNSNANK